MTKMGKVKEKRENCGKVRQEKDKRYQGIGNLD